MIDLTSSTEIINNLNGWIVAVLALIGSVVLFGKKTWAGIKWFFGIFKKVDTALDNLLGTPETVDPMTGRTIPAYPPLAHRVSTIEDTLKLLAENQNEIIRLDQNLQEIIKKKEAEHKDIWSAIDALANK